MQKLLTTKQVAEIFQVTERTVTQKFIKEGLKYFPVGEKDFRFEIEDVEEFKEIKKRIGSEELKQLYTPTKRKTKSKSINIDFEKIRINKELNKVV